MGSKHVIMVAKQIIIFTVFADVDYHKHKSNFKYWTLNKYEQKAHWMPDLLNLYGVEVP